MYVVVAGRTTRHDTREYTYLDISHENTANISDPEIGRQLALVCEYLERSEFSVKNHNCLVVEFDLN